jgi:Holliday junction resolvasome RuvABC ATP-dependent DNA helicase subunit
LCRLHSFSVARRDHAQWLKGAALIGQPGIGKTRLMPLVETEFEALTNATLGAKFG